MATTLFLRFHPEPDRPPEWLLQGAGPVRGGTGLDEAAGCGPVRTVVLVPGSDVLLTRAEVPTAPRHRILQAVPYALEDQLAEEVETLHFAVGRREAGSVPVAVASRALMERWTGALAAAGIEPVRILPATLAVPWESGSWSLLIESGSALLRTGAEIGYAFEPDLLEAALPHVLARDAQPERLRIYDCRPPSERDDTAERCCAAAQMAVERISCGGGPLAVLAAAAEGGIDLLQGPYSRREQLGRRWRPWVPALAMLGVLVLVQGAVALADYMRLARTDRALSARIEQVYRDTFPEAKRVVDPRAQMEHQLALLRGGSGRQELADLMTRAGPVLAQTSGLQLKGLRYREGELELDILLADLAGLDRLKQNLGGDARLDTDIQNANAHGNTVEARVVLRRRAGT